MRVQARLLQRRSSPWARIRSHSDAGGPLAAIHATMTSVRQRGERRMRKHGAGTTPAAKSRSSAASDLSRYFESVARVRTAGATGRGRPGAVWRVRARGAYGLEMMASGADYRRMRGGDAFRRLSHSHTVLAPVLLRRRHPAAPKNSLPSIAALTAGESIWPASASSSIAASTSGKGARR